MWILKIGVHIVLMKELVFSIFSKEKNVEI